MADLAKSIGVSSAYIYKFFESKQAIGEGYLCLQRVSGQIDQALLLIAESDQSATLRLRSIFKTLLTRSLDLFFQDRKLHDLAAIASAQQWKSTLNHRAMIYSIIEKVVTLNGRESGEFERKTRLTRCVAITTVTTPFSHPLLLEQNA